MQVSNPSQYFEEIYAIYEEAFPEVERRTKEGQKAVFQRPRYRIRVIWSEPEQPKPDVPKSDIPTSDIPTSDIPKSDMLKSDVSKPDAPRSEGPESSGRRILAFLGYWELDSCLFLEHLATTAACRGKGSGKQLIEECIREGQEKGKPLFLEIEPVTEKDPMTGRREGFYHRCGFHTNSFFYEQMPLKPKDSPIPLWVMSWPGPVTEKAFLPFKKEIYREVYGVD